LGVSFILELFTITIGGIMGIKRRILRSPKYRHLKARRFPRTQEKEESKPGTENTQAKIETFPEINPETSTPVAVAEELTPTVTIEEVVLPPVAVAEESAPTVATEEVVLELVETEEEPVEKPKPKPKIIKAKAKPVTKKKATTKKTTRKPRAKKKTKIT
tara:strand:- start:23 stop:502 length:480 start_codon:yes stop_codon:yes gene_type:complete